MNKLPFAWDAERWGAVKELTPEVPGAVYSVVTAGTPEHEFGAELYVVTALAVPAVISPEVRNLGLRSGNVWVYEETDGTSPYHLVEYELLRYKMRNGLITKEELTKNDDSVFSKACYIAASFPAYFGGVAPQRTPWGLTTRVMSVSGGVFFLETETFQWTLALSYAVWQHDLQITAAKGTFFDDGLTQYAQETRFLFFPVEECAPVLYELLRYLDHQDLLQILISKEALATYLCEHFPDYVEAYNESLPKRERTEDKERIDKLRIRFDPKFIGSEFLRFELAALFGL